MTWEQGSGEEAYTSSVELDTAPAPMNPALIQAVQGVVEGGEKVFPGGGFIFNWERMEQERIGPQYC